MTRPRKNMRVVLSDSESDLDNDSDDTSSAVSNIRGPSCRDIDASSQAGDSKTLKRKADMGGINPHNNLTPSPRAFNVSDDSQSVDERLRKRRRITGGGHGRSAYDMKHHPMDDFLRPKFSTKRRENRERISNQSSDTDDGEDEAPSKTVASPNPHRRRSSRNVYSSERPIYSAKWHPLDQMLKDSTSSMKVSKEGNGSKNTRMSSDFSPTLEDKGDSRIISPDFDLYQDVGGASELEGKTAPCNLSQRRSARVSSCKDRRPNYDMKYHVMDSTLRPKAAAKRMKSKLQSSNMSTAFIKSVPSEEICAKQLVNSSDKPSTRRSVHPQSESDGVNSPVVPAWSQLETPYQNQVSLHWNEIQEMDRRIYLLQQGAPINSEALPRDWTHVFKGVLSDEYTITVNERSSQEILEALKARYESVRLGLEKFFDSEPEPASGIYWTLSKAEGFDVYQMKSGSRYWRHQKDSVVKGTTTSISSNNLGLAYETAKNMIGNQDWVALDRVSQGQDKNEAKAPTSMRIVMNEEAGPNEPCLNMLSAVEAGTERMTNLVDGSETGAITETEKSLIESMSGEHDHFSIMSDAELEALLLPAERFLGDGPSPEAAASEAAGKVPTSLAKPFNGLCSIDPEADTSGRNTSSNCALACATQIEKERPMPNVLLRPKGKCDEPQIPKTDGKARKRKSRADLVVTVHEDPPDRTPLVRKIRHLSPVSPGIDIPKENLEGDSLVEQYRHVGLGVPRTRQHRHLEIAINATPPYRSVSVSSSLNSSRTLT